MVQRPEALNACFARLDTDYSIRPPILAKIGGLASGDDRGVDPPPSKTTMSAQIGAAGAYHFGLPGVEVLPNDTLTPSKPTEKARHQPRS